MDTVKQERSGWRDSALSARHRRWGWDAPFVDFDGIEYDDGVPLFMVEYKHASAPPVQPQAANIRALRTVADRADLPFFVVRYARDPWRFHVKPANGIAKRLAILPIGEISERDYVVFRYAIAGRTCPAEILSQFAPPTRHLTSAEIGRVTEEDLRDVGRDAFGITYDDEGSEIEP